MSPAPVSGAIKSTPGPPVPVTPPFGMKYSAMAGVDPRFRRGTHRQSVEGLCAAPKPQWWQDESLWRRERHPLPQREVEVVGGHRNYSSKRSSADHAVDRMTLNW